MLNKKIGLAIILSFGVLAFGMEGQGNNNETDLTDSAESPQAHTVPDMSRGGHQQERPRVVVIDEGVREPDPELLSALNSLDDNSDHSGGGYNTSTDSTDTLILLDIINRLLNESSNINIQDNANNTALMLAVQAGQRESVEMLIRAGSENFRGQLAPTTYVENWPGVGSPALETPRLQHLSLVNRDLQQIINDSAFVSHLAIENDKNVQAKFCLAIEKGDVEAVASCITKGININAKDSSGCTALMKACYRGNTAVVELLLNNGAHVNICEPKYGWTPLMMAAKKGDLKSVMLLISHGADIHTKNKQGQTAAVMTRSSEILEFLHFTTDFLKSAQPQTD